MGICEGVVYTKKAKLCCGSELHDITKGYSECCGNERYYPKQGNHICVDEKIVPVSEQACCP